MNRRGFLQLIAGIVAFGSRLPDRLGRNRRTEDWAEEERLSDNLFTTFDAKIWSVRITQDFLTVVPSMAGGHTCCWERIPLKRGHYAILIQQPEHSYQLDQRYNLCLVAKFGNTYFRQARCYKVGPTCAGFEGEWLRECRRGDDVYYE